MNRLTLFLFRVTCLLLVLSGFIGLCAAAAMIVSSEPTLASTPETASPLRFTTAATTLDNPVLSVSAGWSPPTNICFSTPKGVITINLKDGSVKIPEGMTMDEASREFWLTLAKALPYVRHQLLYGEEKKP